MARSHAAASRLPSRNVRARRRPGAHDRRRRHARDSSVLGRGRRRAGWFVVLGVAGGLLAGAAWAGAGTSDRPAVDAHGRDVDYRTGSAAVMAPAPVTDPAAPADARGAAAGGGGVAATQRAARVLRGWDRARAAAYAAGSVRSLRTLYVGDAGQADVRLLRSYLRRGYRVEGLRMQLLAVRVLRHRAGTWSLRVTDRVAGAVAVGYGERVALPRDRASTRTVVLRRAGTGDWRVVRVRG